MDTLRHIGERELIRRLVPLLPGRADVAVGAGDDVAVVRPEGSSSDFLLTSDAVIEGVHFLPDTPPERIGHKAVGRALSDLASAGGEPLWALVDLSAPPDTPVERIEGVYRGLSALAARFHLAVIGGDTARGPALELHVFAVGRVPRGTALLRSGARPGDTLYVTGSLGGSLLGRHLDVEPRVAEGRWLREGGWASAMIDVSDGLATDLRHLLDASGAGAEFLPDRVPVSEAAKQLRDGRSSLDHAMSDGEDFELLFAVPVRKQPGFEGAWHARFPLPCARIGIVLPGTPRIVVKSAAGAMEEFRADGFEHFRPR